MSEHTDFSRFNLPSAILSAIQTLGFKEPTPIQAQAIPALLSGQDVLGQAQTGTGKTAAFGLPMLARIDTEKKYPQLMIVAPTRELAIQVSEAISVYAQNLKGFHIATLFGGSDYRTQLRDLKKSPQVVVATPGRLIDHIKRGSLSLETVTSFVLDEADEMLKMGFIDDVKWLLEQLPENYQLALFSATMPKQIGEIARKYLRKPLEIKIKAKEAQLQQIQQYYWVVNGMNKRTALHRILETEKTDGVIIFVRTKSESDEVANFLRSKSFEAMPLNGDIPQELRNKSIERLKAKKIDILVATDVAARGLDIERVSHVINYDAPFNSESYVHRIGRTGRAGRSGVAILFLHRKEHNSRFQLERATNSKIEQWQVPSAKALRKVRLDRLRQQMAEVYEQAGFKENLDFIKQSQHDLGITDGAELAAVIATLTSFVPPVEQDEPVRESRSDSHKRPGNDRGRKRERGDRFEGRDRRQAKTRVVKFDKDAPMQAFRVEVGRDDGIGVGNIVGAIANEAGIAGKFIQQVRIKNNHTTLMLPKGMPKDTFNHVKKVRVGGKQLNLSEI